MSFLTSSGIPTPVSSTTKSKKVVTLISSHNFQLTPTNEQLAAMFQEARDRGADIVKIAAMAQSQQDVIDLLQFTLQHKKDSLVTISLGELGRISRLVFPLWGSLLTYACLGSAFAPGQVSLKQLQDDFKIYA